MSPLLLLLAAHHTVPVILQHRSGQGAKHKRGWELGRTKKCFRSGGACHEGKETCRCDEQMSLLQASNSCPELEREAQSREKSAVTSWNVLPR